MGNLETIWTNVQDEYCKKNSMAHQFMNTHNILCTLAGIVEKLLVEGDLLRESNFRA